METIKDEELNKTFAIKVLGYIDRKSGFEIPPMRAIHPWISLPNFINCLDDLISCLSKIQNEIIIEKNIGDKTWCVTVDSWQSYTEDESLNRALMLALISCESS